VQTSDCCAFKGYVIVKIKMKSNVTHAISLGGNCSTSMFMKVMCIKRYSCPFDWVGITLPNVLDILKADFRTFLDPEQLIEHSDGSPLRCGHKLYGVDMFHHFNPRLLTHHNEYYGRCIDRFRSLKDVSPDEHVMFMYQEFRRAPSVHAITELRDELERYRGSCKFLLVVFIHDVNCEGIVKPEIEVDFFMQSVLVVRTRLVGGNNGASFTSLVDHEAIETFLIRLVHFRIPPSIPHDNDAVENTAHDIDLRT